MKLIRNHYLMDKFSLEFRLEFSLELSLKFSLVSSLEFDLTPFVRRD